MLCDRIKELRKASGYSQQQLAMKLHLTQGAISQWERGTTYPAADQLVSLAAVFGISVDELLEVEKEKPKDPYEDDVMQIREMLRRDPAYRTMFNTISKATPEHIRAAVAMLKALEPKDDDD